MEVSVNTKHPLVRLILALVAFIFTPAGIWVLVGAFGRHQPHVFVMLMFSGSLTFLLGLVGLIGFIASFSSQKQEFLNEKSTSPDRGNS